MPAPDQTSLSLPARFVEQLAADRAAYHLPPYLPETAERLIHAYLGLLFPHFTRHGADDVGPDTADFLNVLGETLEVPGVDDSLAVCRAVASALADLRAALLRDAAAIAASDPAAGGTDEVVLAYPGFFATAVHRLAHVLWHERVPILPRLLGELAHRATGIDIHPGASIGADFAIDHGTGVVIGETCVIGDRVRIYQGVTLGALVVEKSMQSKRHPTVEDDVVIYSGATILGGDTVIGAGTRIGGNVWLTRSVPAGSFVATSAGVDRRRSPAADGESTDDDLEFHL